MSQGSPTDFLSSYESHTVLVTGHTGFKGSWLSLWLAQLGARVVGLARQPETQSLYVQADVGRAMDSYFIDIRDRTAVASLLNEVQPDAVFHLAAQSLVRHGYQFPVETYDTNVIGTVNLLESLRAVPNCAAIVVVTSDKCYRNTGTTRGYQESDPLGGEDPYSSSKACAEIVTASYRNSYFAETGSPLVATVRAGNVIGGGDWSADRLMPDVARAMMANQPVVLRNPTSTRPWQHVLEPLRGYLMLGARLLKGSSDHAQAWNLGPDESDVRSVEDLAEVAIRAWGSGSVELGKSDPDAPEAATLRLDSSKARRLLGYRQLVDFDKAVTMTVAWYKRFAGSPTRARDTTLEQLTNYMHLIQNGR